MLGYHAILGRLMALVQGDAFRRMRQVKKKRARGPKGNTLRLSLNYLVLWPSNKLIL